MTSQNYVPESHHATFKLGRSWQEIAEEAAKEQDGQKLLALTDELLEALEKTYR